MPPHPRPPVLPAPPDSSVQGEVAAHTPAARRRARRLEAGIVLSGVFLAGVGPVPVDGHFWIHTALASGMVLVFAALAAGIGRLVPPIPAAFRSLGLVFLVVIAVAVVMFFPLGHDNLTAVELIAGSLVFAWLIVPIRNLAALEADPPRDPA